MSDLETAQMHLDAANRSVLGLLEAVDVLTRERDAAREDCGFQKGMRASISQELDTFIGLKMGLDDEVKRLRALARDVVMDYGAKCCDDLTGCACSMARLSRAAG